MSSKASCLQVCEAFDAISKWGKRMFMFTKYHLYWGFQFRLPKFVIAK